MLKACLVVTISVGLVALSAGYVSGQNYPNKPIRIVTSGVGGGSDFTARQIAQGISAPLGQPVIVENRGGGGYTTGEIVAKAPPDGYTLLVTGNSLWIGPLFEKSPYDVARDFSPITMTSYSPLVLVVHPSVAANSLKELIALAKARPTALNYASGATGSSNHFAGEMLKAMAGVNIERITYKGGGAALNDLLGGQIQLMFTSGNSVVAQIKSGRLRALAVTSVQPSALFPGLPTMAASGVPGYELVSVDGILATGRTPVAIINQLNQQIVQFLKTAEAKERFFNSGVEAIGSSPQEFAQRIKSDTAMMSKVMKDAGIKPE